MKLLNIYRVDKNQVKLLAYVAKILRGCMPSAHFSSAPNIDTLDLLSNDLLERRHPQNITSTIPFNKQDFNIRYFFGFNSKSPTLDIKDLSNEELEQQLLGLMEKNKEDHIRLILTKATEYKKIISLLTLRKLMTKCAAAGKPEIVEILQKHYSTLKPDLYTKNGEFLHYLAKAHCLKGNTDKGLCILQDCYLRYEGFRRLYQIILRELIHDTVLNKSEASMVIFKRHVLHYSVRWKDHNPLLNFWYLCWSSSWFSNHMLADELLDESTELQNVVKEKALIYSLQVLNQDYNEDAVLRLLQALLKYKMMDEYVLVLQILFSYKLRNNDLRGCTEIIRNCEALGITLPATDQSMYLCKMIEGNHLKRTPPKSKTFKLKF